ncbi:signal recognition particle 14kD protein-domain-containing protein [Rhodotorula diobovata]|uniref:Signal recognition particle subunit SRP14 n=1 Tax=Rhodotorula diobovata TaxID=5288 RepID=A0A5C5FN97_9BASI|nr:signal recognition particle 14kD protein-domain-containing protein [Rhodotorula diobovata]
MAHLSNDEFLIQLEQLFAARKDKGSVFLLQKRMTWQPEASTSTAPAAGAPGDDVEMGDSAGERRADEDREWPLLLRATDGKSDKKAKVKLTTVVQPPDVTPFLDRYSLLLRQTFSSALRPKRKRADLLRARTLRQLTRAAARTARKTGEPQPGREELEERAARAVKASEARAKAAGAGAGAGAFRPALPKVVGPRRGNGVQRRRRAERRREKAVQRAKRKASAKAGP